MKRLLPTALLTFAIIGTGFTAEIDEIAREVLNPQKTNADREALISGNLSQAPALLQAMVRDLEVGTPKEYERIPWIWRVALAVGKTKDADAIARVLEVSLPKESEPLQHWQAVVIGGGIINGLSLEGAWPSQRLADIVHSDEKLKARWERTLRLAIAMADDEKVPAGTRYDALRMIAMLPWRESGEQLSRYLRKDVHAELQQGAISGLADMESEPVAQPLISSLLYLPERNRELALKALLRTESRRAALREAISSGKLQELPPPVLNSIKESIAQQRETPR